MRGRRLSDLVSVGKATLGDFARLGVTDVETLARCDPEELYERLGRLDGAPHDVCVLDTLRAAVAQARDPSLPTEQGRWWYWSRLRKRQVAPKHVESRRGRSS